MAVKPEEMRKLLRVYFIMGSVNCSNDPEEVLQSAIKGGITLFQYREKGKGCLQGKEKLQLAKRLQTICRANHIPFIVNDDIELAIELDADGVHIGQEDEPASMVRKKIGNKILGVSAHRLDEARKAIAEGADYLGIGPIYPTSTKEDAKAVQGLSFIKVLRASEIKIPLVGIGGITAENAAPIIGAGADGVSVITAISQADSPDASARLLYEAVNEK
ncbi:thiamine phosphate synthase [Bacillus sp. ISL-47]|uniref:thiamine phosphate synthase n=1 Tax=Bacillus sp. ISL-47 TaxID=2819130 RepID=UPI001BE7A8D5|nr:thiamine phosphate synthase [Bacillus sp. ISL-47]MBT2689708.1 thiamine phosphate synthase [Bacillus sp. ISL-47]MBT2710002.1 thiamine phosphate synthase [Pseudomonas sp. ISL-84]